MNFERAFAAMSNSDAQAVIIQPLFDPHLAVLLEPAAKTAWRPWAAGKPPRQGGWCPSLTISSFTSVPRSMLQNSQGSETR